MFAPPPGLLGGPMRWPPSKWLALAICVDIAAVVLVVEAQAAGQRPPGWLSGFTKDGREYWYHPDNPSDVRMQGTAPAPKTAPATAPPPQSAQAAPGLTTHGGAAPQRGLGQGQLESRPASTGRDTKQPGQGAGSAAETASPGAAAAGGRRASAQPPAPGSPPQAPPDPPPGHYDAFGNLKEIVAKHAVHEAVATSAACVDNAKSYVGGVAERYRRCVKKVRKALQDGASIDEPEPASGHAALMANVLSRHPIAVQALLEEGAAATLRHAKTGHTALDVAADKGYADVVEVMLQLESAAKDRAGLREAMVALAPVDGLAPIHRACAGETHGHAEVRLIIAAAECSFTHTDHLRRFCACGRWSKP